MLKRLWREDEGVLTFEWILLVTLLVIGITGSLCGVRDAINNELAGVAGAMVSLDQSYSISSPVTVAVFGADGTGGGSASCTAGSVSSSYADSASQYGVHRHNGTTTHTPSSTMAVCTP